MSTDTQHFSLRWNNYLRHITRAFDSLRSDDNFVDVTLSCEGKQIRAHKMLLSACSTYFRDLFKENPCQHPIIILKNVKFEDLEALVEFIYQGEVNVVQDQLTSFLTTAELLAVQGLTNDPSKEVEEPPEEVSLEPPRPAKPKRSLPENRTPSPTTSRSSRKRRRTQNNEESFIKKPIVEDDYDDDVTFVPEMMPSLKVEIPEYIDNNVDLNQPAEEPNEIDDTADNSCDAYDEQPDAKNDAMDLQNIVYEAQGDDLTGTEMSHMLDNPGTSDNLQDPTLQDLQQLFGNEEYLIDTTVDYSGSRRQSGIYPVTASDLITYPCFECGKIFKHPDSLRQHMQKHKGSTQCPICYVSLSRTYELKVHMRKKHLISPV